MPFWHFLCISIRFGDLQKAKTPVLVISFGVSLKKGHKFYDAKAVELVNKIDYDFSSAEGDSTMSNGVIARTLVFDELVEDFIDRNPDCTIVNIACGLDTRFYRMDNGKLRW